MTDSKHIQALPFTADDTVTMLMALEAAMFLADTIGNKAEHDKARELRDRVVTALVAARAMHEKASGATVQ